MSKKQSASRIKGVAAGYSGGLKAAIAALGNTTNGERKMTPWNLTEAVSIQSRADGEMQRAIEEKRTFGIYIGASRIVTAASLQSAKSWVGKSKRYTIIAD